LDEVIDGMDEMMLQVVKEALHLARAPTKSKDK